jgi:crotonobetainyl-CoA:carnitine CoA-transferase CaiB-like acyl-CoA transferase
MTTAALHGIRVADFSRVLAGPYASMMLADLGADVIKIESPDGDDTRQWRPPVDEAGTSTYFASVNRNKRSLVCDLRSAEGKADALRLIGGADIVLENFRPGAMAAFGLDPDALMAGNPSLIWCSITGFGTDQGAHLPGYDLLVQAMGGLMSITGQPESGPTKAGVALVDVLTGQNALAGILAALHARTRTGRGQRVEVNLLSSLLAALVNQASSTLATGNSPTRLGNAHPSISPYETYAAADRELVIAVGNDRQFRSLCAVLGLPDLADDDRYATNEARVSNRATLKAAMERVLGTRPAGEWAELLTAARVPAGKVNTVGEAFALAGDLGLEAVVDIRDPATGATSHQVANPISLSLTPPQYRTAPPPLGAHPDADWLPIDQEEEP